MRTSDGDMALHLMTLDNFLGGQGGVSGAADAREALEQITDYLAGENAEIARLRRDCAELYQVIGVLAEPHADLNGRPVLKVLNNALAAANGQPRPHDDLLPFTLPAPPAPDGWRPIETAPKDRFVLLWCPRDKSRWLAKWQNGRWYGVCDLGLTRDSVMHRDAITHWRPLPAPPEE